MIDLDSMITQINALEKTLEKDSKKVFTAWLKEHMPEQLQAFRWKQYTPGFNDGDPCTFRTTIDYPEVPLVDDEGDTGDWTEYDGEDKKVDSFFTKCGKIPDQILEYAFGDGSQVTVKRDGKSIEIEVEDYDCGY